MAGLGSPREELQPGSGTTAMTPRTPRSASRQGGIGIVLQPNNAGEMVITRLVPNGPAEQSAKVQAGDVLMSVDGMLVQGWKMADILRMIVGDDETFVTLGLTRHGEGFSTSIKRSAKPMPAGHTPGSVTVSKQPSPSPTPTSYSPPATATRALDSLSALAAAPEPPRQGSRPASGGVPPSPSLGSRSEQYDAVSEISHSRRGGRRTALVSISALPEFAHQSLEELRAEHYLEHVITQAPTLAVAPSPLLPTVLTPVATHSGTRALPPLPPLSDPLSDSAMRSTPLKTGSLASGSKPPPAPATAASVRAPSPAEAVGYVDVAVVAVKNVPALGSLVPPFDICCSVVVDGTEHRTGFAQWDQEVSLDEEFRYMSYAHTGQVHVDILARSSSGTEVQALGKCVVDVSSLIKGGASEPPLHGWYYVHGARTQGMNSQLTEEVICTSAGPCQIHLRLRASAMSSDVSKLAKKKAREGFNMSPQTTPRNSGSVMLGSGAGYSCEHSELKCDKCGFTTFIETTMQYHLMECPGATPSPQNVESPVAVVRCAPSLREPPSPAQTTSWTATGLEIKLVSGRHLPKMDFLGSCDPFVEFEWSNQTPLIATSSIKKNTLSPDWDETFPFEFTPYTFQRAFDSPTEQPQISITVSDWNKMSKAHFVGKTSISAQELHRILIQQPADIPPHSSATDTVEQVELALVNAQGKPVLGKDKSQAVLKLTLRAVLKASANQMSSPSLVGQATRSLETAPPLEAPAVTTEHRAHTPHSPLNHQRTGVGIQNPPGASSAAIQPSSPQPPAEWVSMVLEQDFDHVTSSAIRRQSFERQLTADVAAALETQEDRLRVVDMQRGSVVVDLHILPGASDAKPSQDLAHKLVIMVADSRSALRKTALGKTATRVELKGPVYPSAGGSGQAQQASVSPTAPTAATAGPVSSPPWAHPFNTRGSSSPPASLQLAGSAKPTVAAEFVSQPPPRSLALPSPSVTANNDLPLRWEVLPTRAQTFNSQHAATALRDPTTGSLLASQSDRIYWGGAAQPTEVKNGMLASQGLPQSLAGMREYDEVADGLLPVLTSRSSGEVGARPWTQNAVGQNAAGDSLLAGEHDMSMKDEGSSWQTPGTTTEERADHGQNAGSVPRFCLPSPRALILQAEISQRRNLSHISPRTNYPAKTPNNRNISQISDVLTASQMSSPIISHELSMARNMDRYKPSATDENGSGDREKDAKTVAALAMTGTRLQQQRQHMQAEKYLLQALRLARAMQNRKHHNPTSVTNSIFDGLAECGFFERPENFHDARMVTDYVRTERLTRGGISDSLVAAAAAAITTPKPWTKAGTSPSKDVRGESRNLKEVEDVYGPSVVSKRSASPSTAHGTRHCNRDTGAGDALEALAFGGKPSPKKVSRGEAAFWGENGSGEQGMSKLDALERELLMAETAPFPQKVHPDNDNRADHASFSPTNTYMPQSDDYARTAGPARDSGWGGNGDAMSYVARSTGTGSRNGDMFGEEASVASFGGKSTAAAAYMPTPAPLGRAVQPDAAMLYSEREVTAMLQNGLSLLENKDGNSEVARKYLLDALQGAFHLPALMDEPCFAILESQMTRDNSRQEFMKDEVLIVPLIQNALSVMKKRNLSPHKTASPPKHHLLNRSKLEEELTAGNLRRFRQHNQPSEALSRRWPSPHRGAVCTDASVGGPTGRTGTGASRYAPPLAPASSSGPMVQRHLSPPRHRISPQQQQQQQQHEARIVAGAASPRIVASDPFRGRPASSATLASSAGGPSVANGGVSGSHSHRMALRNSMSALPMASSRGSQERRSFDLDSQSRAQAGMPWGDKLELLEMQLTAADYGDSLRR